MAAFLDDDYKPSFTSNSNNRQSFPVLEDGAYDACITKFEWTELKENKGHAVVLTFSVLDPNVNYIHNINCWINIAHKTSEAAINMAKKQTKELRLALEIDPIFDTSCGIKHADIPKILHKMVVIHIKGKEGEYVDFKTKEKKKRMYYNIETFSPIKFSVKRIEQPAPEPQRQQYSPTPTNNPEAEYEAAFGSDPIPF